MEWQYVLLISGDLSLNDLLYWTEASFYPLHITLLRNVKTLEYQRDFKGVRKLKLHHIVVKSQVEL